MDTDDSDIPVDMHTHAPAGAPSAEEPEVATGLTDELENLLGSAKASVHAVSDQPDYIGDALALCSQGATAIVESVAGLLPDDVAAALRQHALVAVVSVLSVLLITLYVLIRRCLAPPPRRSLMLCGPMGAGKTTLFYALKGVELPCGTTTSMQTNDETFTIQGTNRKAEVVDVPGHPRLRSVVQQRSMEAACVVFMVDAADFVKRKREIAEQLYDILELVATARPMVPVLLACNKADLGTRAFGTEFIVSQLQKEITLLRETRQVTLGHEKGPAGDKLMKGDHAFSFDQSLVPVTTCSISAKAGSLDPVLAFVRSHVAA